MHERIDYGMAQLAFVTARTNGAKDVEFSTFLPSYLRPDSEDLVGKLLSFRDEHKKG